MFVSRGVSRVGGGVKRAGGAIPVWLTLVGGLLVLGGCKDAAGPVERREGLPVADSAAAGIDADALATLVAHAEDQHSEAVVVLHRGRIVYENYFGFADAPIYAMSASKSFVSLAFGFLLADGKLASLDVPVADVLNGFTFSAPCKGAMTFRHLLTQTSGIDPGRSFPDRDIEAKALRAGCMFPPGSGWQYANGGIDLLAALAGRLAGKPMDQYLNEKLFRPLGIADVDWMRDVKGVPYGAGEMRIRALDMAKVGQAMLDGGKWGGKQVIPASWVAAVSAPSNNYEPTYGLLWWRGAPVLSVGLTADLLEQWKGYGMADSARASLLPLVGGTYTSSTAYYQALAGALGPARWDAWKTMVNTGDHIPTSRNLSVGPMAYYYAAGWLGQYLVIVPDKQLVGVRMRRARNSDYSSPTEVDGYPGFGRDVAALVP